MRLTIDSELALSSSVGEGFCSPKAVDGAVLLEVRVEKQLLNNWCWAALASALGGYYGTSQASQTEIASRLLEADCTALAIDEELRKRVDREFRLDRAMMAAGCFSHWSAGKPMFDRVRFEINLGRPFCARIEWHQGAAHYVLIHGYRERGEHILVADSLHGPGQYPLPDFPARYREGGAWTETFWSTRTGIRKAEGVKR